MLKIWRNCEIFVRNGLFILLKIWIGYSMKVRACGIFFIENSVFSRFILSWFVFSIVVHFFVWVKMVQILKYFVKSVLISGPVVNEFSKKYSPYNMDHLYELYRIVSTQGSKLVERNADQLCSPGSLMLNMILTLIFVMINIFLSLLLFRLRNKSLFHILPPKKTTSENFNKLSWKSTNKLRKISIKQSPSIISILKQMNKWPVIGY